MGRATDTVIKVRDGRMLRLPKWAVSGFGVTNGGFIRVRKTHAGILLKPFDTQGRQPGIFPDKTVATRS